MAGEKGGHHISGQGRAGVVQQVGQRIAVELVAGGGIAHQQHPLGIILTAVEFLLRVGHGCGLQLGDPLGVHRFGCGLCQGALAPLRAQGPSRGSHTGPAQAASGLCLQTGCDFPDGVGNLTDVLDLAVHHDPPGMQARSHGLYAHPVPRPGGQQTDDAAGADIQRIDQILPLGREGRGGVVLSHRPLCSFLTDARPGKLRACAV